VLFIGCHGFGQLGKVVFFGKCILQPKTDGRLTQRKLGLGDHNLDATIAESLDKGLQLFRGRHIDFRNGSRINNHLLDGMGFTGDEVFQSFD
jgi:hypothetical protein